MRVSEFLQNNQVTKKIFFLLFTISLFHYFTISLLWAEVEFFPLANVSLLGGQYYFEKEAASFGGNLYIDLIPALKFSDELSLIPTYSGAYRGTKNVAELVGGGTLFQEAQDHLLSLRLVNQMREDLKLKIKTSYKLELLKETKDESWGKGLFDYYKIVVGVEGEKKFDKKITSLTGGYGFYMVRFNNYASLAEAKYGKEVSPGKNILDFDAHEVYLYGDFVFTPNFRGKADYSFTYKNFLDQKIVTASGDYLTDKRNDQIHLLNFSISNLRPIKTKLKIVYALESQTVIYQSNQNHYDAKNFKFIPNYYNYWEQGLRPQVILYLGKKPQSVDFSYQFAYRQYSDRLVQDKDGNYKTDKINTQTSTISLGTSYPLREKINLRFQVNYLISSSNMAYEKVYRYNYNTTNYFLGLSWEY